MAPLLLQRFQGSPGSFESPQFRHQDARQFEADLAENPRFPEAAECSQCHSVYREGCWQAARVASAPDISSLIQCPACQQQAAGVALGVVEMHGSRWRSRMAEIWETIERVEQEARARNDQERILWARSYRGVTKIFVTLPGLAQEIGAALTERFEGRLDQLRSQREPYLRVLWQSDPAEQSWRQALRSRPLRRR